LYGDKGKEVDVVVFVDGKVAGKEV